MPMQLTFNDNNASFRQAAAATGLHGEVLAKKALALGLKQLGKAVPKTVRQQNKKNDSEVIVAPLTADDIRKRFLENRKRGVFTPNGLTPEFEKKLAKNMQRPLTMSAETVEDLHQKILGRTL